MPPTRRPRFQFSLLGLMVLMLLAGPLLLMTLLSLFLSLMRRD